MKIKKLNDENKRLSENNIKINEKIKQIKKDIKEIKILLVFNNNENNNKILFDSKIINNFDEFQFVSNKIEKQSSKKNKKFKINIKSF